MSNDLKLRLKKAINKGDKAEVSSLVKTYLDQTEATMDQGKSLAELTFMYMSIKNEIDRRYEKMLDEIIQSYKKTERLDRKIDTLLKKP